MKTLTKTQASTKLLQIQKQKELLLKEERNLSDIINEKPKDITDIVQSFEDGLKYTKKKAFDILPYIKPKTNRQTYLNNVAMLDFLSEIWREKWIPDYSTQNQEKWYNWYKYDALRGCFVFCVTYADYGSTFTGVGARFCFETKTKAELFAKYFIKIINVTLSN